MNNDDLLKLAIDVKKNAYAPFSKFHVGAALLTVNGKVFTGVNVENSTYGATNCAERTAVFKMVSEGERKIAKIAIASDDTDFIYPCGICRQVLAEFSDDDMEVICSKANGEFKVHTLKELLPNAFRLKP